MTTRWKLTLTSIAEDSWSNSARSVRFTTQYDAAIPEDQRPCLGTPLGSFEMVVDNPRVLESLTLGQSYCLDLTPCE